MPDIIYILLERLGGGPYTPMSVHTTRESAEKEALDHSVFQGMESEIAERSLHGPDFASVQKLRQDILDLIENRRQFDDAGDFINELRDLVISPANDSPSPSKQD